MKKHFLKLTVCFLTSFFAVLTLFFNPQINQKPEKEYKILLMLSSFKRPIFLSGQISRLLNQTYKNHDISVSIKGIDGTAAFRNTFLREFDTFEKTGRVFVRMDENGPQLSNLLDTVRHLDVEKYDFFCKIDDDDWYAPDYVENVNREFNYLNNQTTPYLSSAYKNAYILNENIDEAFLYKNNTDLLGPTLCFSKDLIKIALEIDKDPSAIKKYAPTETAGDIHVREDKLLDHMALHQGIRIMRESEYPLVIYGWQYRSVMRNDRYRR